MSKPIFAIVGRPNVGKSTLFNKLIGKRLSIVEDTPGVTRDRLYAEGEWLGKPFVLIDTGGIEVVTNDVIFSQMRTQAQIAIDSADVIIMMTDIKTGLTAADSDVAAMLLKANKPIILCVNKADSVGETPMDFYEFYNLGLGEPFPASSVHGHGTGDLLDKAFSMVSKRKSSKQEDDYTKVAVIGKPNVGKSSLINLITGENRVIVSDVAGTTRDAVDSPVENKHGKYIFIDTAGIRRKSKVEEAIERYSVLRAFMAVERSDVAVIMIDANQGVTEQDTKIAGFAHEHGKACVVLVNKWDTVEKNDKTMEMMRKSIMMDLAFMSYVPILFISALSGQRVDRIYHLINTSFKFNSLRISTGVLNDFLSDVITRVPPPSDKGKRLKLYYMTQVSTNPPSFVIFCNNAQLFHYSYQRHIENRLRETFDFSGTPIRLLIREKGDKAKLSDN